MTEVDKIIQRVRNGEPLRWLHKSQSGRLRPGCIDVRELFIGRNCIVNDLAYYVTTDERLVELPENEDGAIYYELKDWTA